MTDFEKYTLVIRVFTVLGVIATITYGVLQFRASKRTNVQIHEWNRRKAAQDICIRYEEHNPDKTELLDRLKYFSNDGIVSILEIDGLWEERPDLRLVAHRLLNYFEYLCLGIKQGVYDEEVVREFWSTVMQKVLSMLKPYVEKQRKKINASGTEWCLIEEYTNKWAYEKTKNDRRNNVDEAV